MKTVRPEGLNVIELSLVLACCDEAIDLYREYVDTHGYEPVSAKAMALGEVREGYSADVAAVLAELELETSPSGEPSPKEGGLPW